MSNLQSAINAMKGIKKFRITFEEKELFTIEVEAKNKEEASEQANEIYNDGGAHACGSESEEIEIEQIT